MVGDLRAGGRRLLLRKVRGLGLDNAWYVCLIRVRVLGTVRSCRASGGVVSRELRWALSWVSSQMSVYCGVCRCLIRIS